MVWHSSLLFLLQFCGACFNSLSSLVFLLTSFFSASCPSCVFFWCHQDLFSLPKWFSPKQWLQNSVLFHLASKITGSVQTKQPDRKRPRRLLRERLTQLWSESNVHQSCLYPLAQGYSHLQGRVGNLQCTAYRAEKKWLLSHQSVCFTTVGIAKNGFDLKNCFGNYREGRGEATRDYRLTFDSGVICCYNPEPKTLASATILAVTLAPLQTGTRQRIPVFACYRHSALWHSSPRPWKFF